MEIGLYFRYIDYYDEEVVEDEVRSQRVNEKLLKSVSPYDICSVRPRVLSSATKDDFAKHGQIDGRQERATMTAKNDDDKNNNKGAETKPLTSFAPPPTSAILSTAGFIATAVWTFPTLDDDHPPNYDTNIFTRRVFPELVSLKTLLAVRLFFTTIGVLGFAMAWMFPP